MTLDELKAAARAATPGPWVANTDDVWTTTDRMRVANGWTIKDAKYIAAANPEAVLDLIAKLRAAEAVVEAAHDPEDGIWWGWSKRLDAAVRAYDALGGSKQ